MARSGCRWERFCASMRGWARPGYGSVYDRTGADRDCAGHLLEKSRARHGCGGPRPLKVVIQGPSFSQPAPSSQVLSRACEPHRPLRPTPAAALRSCRSARSPRPASRNLLLDCERTPARQSSFQRSVRRQRFHEFQNLGVSSPGVTRTSTSASFGSPGRGANVFDFHAREILFPFGIGVDHGCRREIRNAAKARCGSRLQHAESHVEREFFGGPIARIKRDDDVCLFHELVP